MMDGRRIARELLAVTRLLAMSAERELDSSQKLIDKVRVSAGKRRETNMDRQRVAERLVRLAEELADGGARQAAGFDVELFVIYDEAEGAVKALREALEEDATMDESFRKKALRQVEVAFRALTQGGSLVEDAFEASRGR